MILELLINELEKVIEFYKLPDADFCWSHYNSAEEALTDITDIITALRGGDLSVLDHLSLLFAPTASIGEIAISSGWGDEYLEIAEKVDIIISKLRNKKSNN